MITRFSIGIIGCGFSYHDMAAAVRAAVLNFQVFKPVFEPEPLPLSWRLPSLASRWKSRVDNPTEDDIISMMENRQYEFESLLEHVEVFLTHFFQGCFHKKTRTKTKRAFHDNLNSAMNGRGYPLRC